MGGEGGEGPYIMVNFYVFLRYKAPLPPAWGGTRGYRIVKFKKKLKKGMEGRVGPDKTTKASFVCLRPFENGK